MSDATSAGPPATPAAPPAATPALAGAPTKDRSAKLIEKAVKQQSQLIAEQAAKDLADPEAAAGAAPGRERDPKTGHFLPVAGKAAAPRAKTLRAGADPGGGHPSAAPGATPGPATTPDKPVTPTAEETAVGGLGKARRLVSEGKLAEAMQLIGLDPSKLESPKWAAWRHQQEKAAKLIVETRATVERERSEVEQISKSLVRDFAPFVRAKQAFDKEDYEEAFQLAFGMDLNSFQRKALASMHGPGVAKDPVISELRKEIAALRQEREQDRQQMTDAQKQADLHQRRQVAWNRNVTTLADSGDPRMATLSENPKFMRAVWAIQGQHYDESTDSTLPPLEAAELALEQIEAEHADWSKVFGGASAPSDETATMARSVHAATGPSGTSARRTARAVTSLNPAEAAEAAPAHKLKGKELIEYHVRLAKAAELRSNGV